MLSRMTKTAIGLAAMLLLGATIALAQEATPGTARTGLDVNQTQGFGDNQLLTFTYTQQFDCVVQPFDDRTYNNRPAALYPIQFDRPECQIGAPSTIDPTGLDVNKTDKLYVLVPFFESDPNQPAFTPKLGAALKSLLGFVPDAFKITPGVAVQCPEPGSPITKAKGRPGTCTMHPRNLDLGPVLTALGLIPPKTVLDLPLVNHSHLLAKSALNVAAEWWQVIVVLVSDPAEWPDVTGSSGITSVEKLHKAQAANHASAEVASNFFLFFSSQAMAGMPGMAQ